MSEQRPLVLVVDDERGMRETVADVLDLDGIDVLAAATGAEALAACDTARPALAIVDYRLPDTTGIELAARLKERDADVVVIALTGHASLENAIAAVGLVDVYLTKPVPPEQLLASVRSALERRALVDQNRSLVAQLREANRKLAAQVDESELRLMTFIDFAPDAVVVLDDRREIVVANRAAEELAGVANGDLVGAPFVRSFRAGQGVVVRPDGSTVPVSIATRPLPGTDPALVAVSIRDETERRETESALRRAFDRERAAGAKLREADAVKDDFLATVSHELRTPLTAVAGFTELLLKPDAVDDETRVHLLERVAANADDMRRMVDRLLDFARLSAGRVRCDPRPVDLAAEVGACVAAHGHELADRRVHVDVPAVLVCADPDGFGHVLGNLLSNAAKFSPEAEPVRVTATVDGAAVVVRVADHGPGVPMDDADALFDRFVQGRASVPSRRGAGLGLAIAKRYVELQGGRIWFEDVPRGATVAFTVPAAS